MIRKNQRQRRRGWLSSSLSLALALAAGDCCDGKRRWTAISTRSERQVAFRKTCLPKESLGEFLQHFRAGGDFDERYYGNRKENGGNRYNYYPPPPPGDDNNNNNKYRGDDETTENNYYQQGNSQTYDWYDDESYNNRGNEEDGYYYDDRGRGVPSSTQSTSSESSSAFWNSLPSMFRTGDRRVGLSLVGAGSVVTMLGISLFFNKALLRLGNLLFITGVAITLGLSRTASFFLQPEKLRAAICLGIGIFLVLIGSPVFGMMLEVFGLLNLFGNMFPVVLMVAKTMPGIGPLLNNWGNKETTTASSRDRYYQDDKDQYDSYYDDDGRSRRGFDGGFDSDTSRGYEEDRNDDGYY